MQDELQRHPATSVVLYGETLWQRKEGFCGNHAPDCHGDAGTSMKGGGGALSGSRGARPPVELEQRITCAAPNRIARTPVRLLRSK